MSACRAGGPLPAPPASPACTVVGGREPLTKGRGKGPPFPTPLLCFLCLSLPPYQLLGVLWAATDHLPEAFGSTCHPAHSFLETLVYKLSFQYTCRQECIFPV